MSEKKDLLLFKISLICFLVWLLLVGLKLFIIPMIELASK